MGDLAGYQVVGTFEDLGVSAGKTTPFDRPDLGKWLDPALRIGVRRPLRHVLVPLRLGIARRSTVTGMAIAMGRRWGSGHVAGNCFPTDSR